MVFPRVSVDGRRVSLDLVSYWFMCDGNALIGVPPSSHLNLGTTGVGCL